MLYNWLVRPLFSWSSIITVRGAILLLLGIYLLLGPAIRDKDIVATVVGGTLVLITISATLITALTAWYLRRRIRLAFSAAENVTSFSDTRAIVPNTPVLIVSTLGALSVPPGFMLTHQLNFEHEGVLTAVHALTGKYPSTLKITEQMNFPHRGDWRPNSFAVSVGDRFGISMSEWSVSSNTSAPNVRVYPPRSDGNSIPIMSSCHRAGDDLVDTNNREGDLFDLKRYHPSDGVNRILWKIYAKSGELISRHPESAVAPEGQVVLYALVRPQDDLVCGEMLAYLKNLERHGLEVIVGCCGMADRAPARSSIQAENLLIESVWDSASSAHPEMLQELLRFVDGVRSRDRDLRFDRVLLFFEGELFNSQSDVAFAASIGDRLIESGIDPVFIVRRPDGMFEQDQRRGEMTTNTLADYLSTIGNLLIQAPARESPEHGRCFGEFLSLCLRRQWQLVSP